MRTFAFGSTRVLPCVLDTQLLRSPQYQYPVDRNLTGSGQPVRGLEADAG